MERTARISADGLYRYELTRTWAPGENVCTFFMLNPATADGTKDDPTIRRCIGFAKAWGCDGLRVVNLYAFRATNPKVLLQARDPFGPENEDYLRRAVLSPYYRIAAWGVWKVPKEAKDILTGVQFCCLGRTRTGSPRHPLYRPASTILEPYRL